MTATEPVDLTKQVGKNVRVYAGWDRDRKFAPMAQGEVVAVITGPSVIVRDHNGNDQAWPITLPIEEVP